MILRRPTCEYIDHKHISSFFPIAAKTSLRKFLEAPTNGYLISFTFHRDPSPMKRISLARFPSPGAAIKQPIAKGQA